MLCKLILALNVFRRLLFETFSIERSIVRVKVSAAFCAQSERPPLFCPLCVPPSMPGGKILINSGLGCMYESAV